MRQNARTGRIGGSYIEPVSRCKEDKAESIQVSDCNYLSEQ